MSTWTIQIGDEPEIPLNQAHFTSCVIQRQSLALETASFSVKEQVDVAGWTRKTRGIIRKRDGETVTVVFVGNLTKPITTANGRHEGKDYTLAGPGWWLQRHQYRQVWTTRTIGGTGSESIARYVWFTRGFLGGEGVQALEHISVGQEVAALFLQVRNDGTPVQLGSASLNVYPPPMRGESRHSDEVLRVLLALVPDATEWWDHTALSDGGEPRPAYHVARYAALETITLAAREGCTEVAFTEELENRPEYVRFYLQRQPALEGESGYGTAIEQTTKGDETAPPFGGIEMVFDEHRTADGSLIDIDLLEDLAQAYFESANGPAWSGGLVWVGPDGEPHPTIRPGLKLRVTGGDPAWETMDALVQSVTHDILAGRTVVRCGPVGVYGIEELRNLLQRLRRGYTAASNMDLRQKATGESPRQNFGHGDHQPGNDETDPDNRDCCSDYSGGHGGS